MGPGVLLAVPGVALGAEAAAAREVQGASDSNNGSARVTPAARRKSRRARAVAAGESMGVGDGVFVSGGHGRPSSAEESRVAATGWRIKIWPQIQYIRPPTGRNLGGHSFGIGHAQPKDPASKEVTIAMDKFGSQLRLAHAAQPRNNRHWCRSGQSQCYW